jgi:KaiC/GvpD/RAD55 family RecA-like ATPase
VSSNKVRENARLGVDLIDSLLPRGVLPDSLIAVIGPPGLGKSFITRKIVEGFLAEGGPVFYVSLDDVVYAREDEGFYVINGFKTSIPLPNNAFTASINPENPGRALETISNIVASRTGGRRGLIVVDSINTILVASDPFVALDFIRGLKALCRKHGLLGLVTLHTGIPGFEQLEAIITYMVDGVIEMEYDPNLEEMGIPLRRIRIRRMRGVPHSLQWVPFTITDEGPVPVDVSSLLEKISKALSIRRSSS